MDHVINVILSLIILPAVSYCGVRLYSIPTRKELEGRFKVVDDRLSRHEARDDEGFKTVEEKIDKLGEKVDRHFEKLYDTQVFRHDS